MNATAVKIACTRYVLIVPILQANTITSIRRRAIMSCNWLQSRVKSYLKATRIEVTFE